MALSKSTAGEAEALSAEAEAALVTRAKAGDRPAMEQLLRAHQDRVYRTALRWMGGREDDARELAQEVLITAFRKLGSFRGDSRLATWLYRMTGNLAKNRFVATNRDRARFVPLDPSDPADDDTPGRDFADHHAGVRDQVAGAESLELLHKRLDQLDPEFREVIILRYFEDLSYEEIAEATGAALGTVKSRINRARAELRRLMADVLEEGT